MTRFNRIRPHVHGQPESSIVILKHTNILNSRATNITLVAIFCLGLLLVIASPAKFHGDEKFYDNAAIRMVQTGDYWTPYFADGQIRLLKPILTYWAAAGSFHIFGINLFGSRFVFALAGVLLICLTYQLAKIIFNSRRTALLAALILACNVEVLTLSTRATPDALLCLFVAVSMLGFARVWFRGDKTFLGPLLAFGGIGLAVQTKGLLGLCPLGAALLFWLVAKPDSARTKKLLNLHAIAIGIFLALFWYAMMLNRHGGGAIKAFFDDQVGNKVTASLAFMLGNFTHYLTSTVRHFMPWTLLFAFVLIWKRRELRVKWKQHKQASIFLLGLLAILVVSFSFSNMRRARYLTAADAMFAVFLARGLAGLTTHDAFQKFLRWAIVAFALGLAAVGIGMIAEGFIFDARFIAGGAIFLAVGGGGIFLLRNADKTWRWVWMSGAMFLGFVVFGTCLRPVLSPPPCSLITQALLKQNRLATPVFTWKITPTQAGQIRMLSGGQLIVSEMKTNASLPDFSGAEIALTVSPNQILFEQTGYRLQEIPMTNAMLATFPRLGKWICDDEVKTTTTSYWIAVKSFDAKPAR